LVRQNARRAGKQVVGSVTDDVRSSFAGLSAEASLEANPRAQDDLGKPSLTIEAKYRDTCSEV
jgi:hypothetical protein